VLVFALQSMSAAKNTLLLLCKRHYKLQTNDTNRPGTLQSKSQAHSH